MAGAVAPDDGPVLVVVEYRVARERADGFAKAMHALGRLRRREGAIHWLLASDLENPDRHLETYLVSSFDKYERQAERTVRADLAVHEAVRRFHLDPEEPRVGHLMATTAAFGCLTSLARRAKRSTPGVEEQLARRAVGAASAARRVRRAVVG